jgi:hypothetical protein
MGFFARQFMLDSTSSASDARTHTQSSHARTHTFCAHTKKGVSMMACRRNLKKEKRARNEACARKFGKPV